jgi:hypothetical protein
MDLPGCWWVGFGFALIQHQMRSDCCAESERIEPEECGPSAFHASSARRQRHGNHRALLLTYRRRRESQQEVEPRC